MSRDPMTALALAAAAHLRKEAEFNRNWVASHPAYSQRSAGERIRRTAIAEERERFAAAIETLAARPAGAP